MRMMLSNVYGLRDMLSTVKLDASNYVKRIATIARKPCSNVIQPTTLLLVIFQFSIFATVAAEDFMCPHEDPQLIKYGFIYGTNETDNICLTVVYNLKSKREWYANDAIQAGSAICEKFFANGKLHLDWFGSLADRIPKIASQNSALHFLIGGAAIGSNTKGVLLRTGDGNEFNVDGARKAAFDQGNARFPRCLSAKYDQDKKQLTYNTPFPCDEHKLWNWSAVVCRNEGIRKCNVGSKVKQCVFSSTHDKCCPLLQYERNNSNFIEELVYPCDKESFMDCNKDCPGFKNTIFKELKNVGNETKGRCGYITISKLFLPKSSKNADCKTTMCCADEMRKFIGHCPCRKDNCENGGTCVDDSLRKWHCVCGEGYTGVQCEKQIEASDAHPKDFWKKEYKKHIKRAVSGSLSAMLAVPFVGIIAYSCGYNQGIINGACKISKKRNTTLTDSSASRNAFHQTK